MKPPEPLPPLSNVGLIGIVVFCAALVLFLWSA